MADFFGSVLLLTLLLFGGIAAVLYALTERDKLNDAKRKSIEEERENRYLVEYNVKHIAIGGESMVGIRPATRQIVIKIEQDTKQFPYASLRAVSLTPVTATCSETTGETKTSRGSQIIGAGLGAAIAGPAGFIVGGLSGKTNHDSFTTSNTYTIDLELELMLRDDDWPRVVLHAGQMRGGGRCLSPEAEKSFKEMAARLANVIDDSHANRISADPHNSGDKYQSP